jgi:MoxR-like ATPase
VLLIDEIDKADIEFPNDLLQELDRMEFDVHELGERVRAKRRPLVVITSNSEKDLPDAFLRRCLFHYIRFPDAETMEAIVRVHHPDLERRLLVSAMRLFYELRDVPGLRKKPSTSELIDWIKLLVLDRAGPDALDAVNLREALPPHLHALVKSEVDLSLLESLGRRF